MAPLDGASGPSCCHPALSGCTFPTAEPARPGPPSASTASATLAPAPGLLSLPHRLLQVILAIIPGGSPGAQGGAPCACAALRAAWLDGVVGRARSAVASLLAEDGAQALAASLYNRPQLLLPGVAAAPDAGGRMRPWLLRWAAMELAAHGGRPLPEQAARLLTLGLARHDATLVRAVLRWSALPKDLLAGDELVGRLLLAARASDGAAMLRALLNSGVWAQWERNGALAHTVRARDPEAARLLLAAGADAMVALRRAVEQDSVEGIRLLAGLGVSFAAQGGSPLLSHAARQGSPLVVGELLRGGRWEYGHLRCALEAALEANRVQSAGLLRDALARVGLWNGCIREELVALLLLLLLLWLTPIITFIKLLVRFGQPANVLRALRALLRGSQVEPHHLRAAFRPVLLCKDSWAKDVAMLLDALQVEAGRAEDVAGSLLMARFAIRFAIVIAASLVIVVASVLSMSKAWVEHRRRVRVPLGEAPAPGD
ncbi:hypothetical protein TSOC_006435 [Tetrabaena socialis]|uniref:Ankyrin repeat domain-containing protein n=1 Tax=Tetrabaena socialis TaxID=47790 RepID=A0A2J8A3Q9_9CHLO|nr:hypothetical protein TSOC_006435 [Tetrabaena socialis]|eukprot:PNH07138.1 hypothetical protein TSOC_006435 [Tetrabaena socialis]